MLSMESLGSCFDKKKLTTNTRKIGPLVPIVCWSNNNSPV
jgi:hypothetical protein